MTYLADLSCFFLGNAPFASKEENMLLFRACGGIKPETNAFPCIEKWDVPELCGSKVIQITKMIDLIFHNS